MGYIAVTGVLMLMFAVALGVVALIFQFIRECILKSRLRKRLKVRIAEAEARVEAECESSLRLYYDNLCVFTLEKDRRDLRELKEHVKELRRLSRRQIGLAAEKLRADPEESEIRLSDVDELFKSFAAERSAIAARITAFIKASDEAPGKIDAAGTDIDETLIVLKTFQDQGLRIDVEGLTAGLRDLLGKARECLVHRPDAPLDPERAIDLAKEASGKAAALAEQVQDRVILFKRNREYLDGLASETLPRLRSELPRALEALEWLKAEVVEEKWRDVAERLPSAPAAIERFEALILEASKVNGEDQDFESAHAMLDQVFQAQLEAQRPLDWAIGRRGWLEAKRNGLPEMAEKFALAYGEAKSAIEHGQADGQAPEQLRQAVDMAQEALIWSACLPPRDYDRADDLYTKALILAKRIVGFRGGYLL